MPNNALAKEFEIVSNRFIQLVRWAMVLALGGLLMSMITGQSGISNYIELSKNKNDLTQRKMQLMVENLQLQQNIENLSRSPEAQQHFLKDKFGFVGKGEFVYHFNQFTGPAIKMKKRHENKSAASEIAANKPQI